MSDRDRPPGSEAKLFVELVAAAPQLAGLVEVAAHRVQAGETVLPIAASSEPVAAASLRILLTALDAPRGPVSGRSRATARHGDEESDLAAISVVSPARRACSSARSRASARAPQPAGVDGRLAPQAPRPGEAVSSPASSRIGNRPRLRRRSSSAASSGRRTFVELPLDQSRATRPGRPLRSRCGVERLLSASPARAKSPVIIRALPSSVSSSRPLRVIGWKQLRPHAT